jgi:aminopeptidase
MPSYEIFVTPHLEYTNGVVHTSLPVNNSGSTIEDIRLEFKRGKVVNFQSRTGSEALAALINFDKGAAYLGELGLVEHGNPIFNQGIVFGDTLYDENAASHIGLGTALTASILGASELSAKDQRILGINTSGVHTDMMFGNKDLEVTALTPSGKVRIMEKGKFVI